MTTQDEATPGVAPGAAEDHKTSDGGGQNDQEHHKGNSGGTQEPGSVLAALRRKLRDLGYSPIPCVGKIPPLPGWPEKVTVSDKDIEDWESRHPTATNTGILTKRTPAFDADIRNPEAAQAVEDLIRKLYDDQGTILVRYGQPPKRAILFRSDTSFFKITRDLIGPDGAGHRIELLANGEQIV